MDTPLELPVASEALAQVTRHQRNGPCAVVIFGGAGDLASRKLLPALYRLFSTGATVHECLIVGVGLPAMDDASYREHVVQAIKLDDAGHSADDTRLSQFLDRVFYVSGNLNDPQMYETLDGLLKRLAQERLGVDNRLYYFAVPPSAFGTIAGKLAARDMARVTGPEHWRRVIVEKPFGRDLDSARRLNRDLEAAFEEWQIYRIDHYLAKEPVQNILALRFGNGIFEPIWNHHHVDHVQISVAETLGVERRGRYFEEAGALRDMVQNHLLQLLALVAMEPPATFDANAVRDEHAKVLRAIRPIPIHQVDSMVVRGQYEQGVMGGEKVAGYREELDVDPESSVETYVAAKLFLDNWRWAGVPFYVRTGKRLAKHVTEIAIFFRRSPHLLFNRRKADCVSGNALVLKIQQEQSISLHFEAKTPGHEMEMRPVHMHFHYEEAFGSAIPDPYARLILDCMKGDATLFMRKDSVEISWWLMQPILEHWAATHPFGFPNYAAGSHGPEDASLLLWKDGRKWKGC